MSIIVRMMGGLGNQIFIYAFVRQLLEQYPNADVFFDLRWFDKSDIRSYELYKYNLDKRIHILEINKQNFGAIVWFDITRTLYKIFEKIFVNFRVQKGLTWLEDSFSRLASMGYCYNYQKYSNVQLPDKKYVYVYGYFQDYRYLEQVKRYFKDELKLKVLSEKYQDIISQIKSPNCAISIRWGEDYVKCGWSICSKKYYLDGINCVKSKIQCEQIIVFADEIEKVKASHIFENEDVLYIEGLSPSESLDMLMKCQNYVVSNSSFSILGVLLSNEENPIVIAPKHWKKDKLVYELNLYRSSMYVIENM